MTNSAFLPPLLGVAPTDRSFARDLAFEIRLGLGVGGGILGAALIWAACAPLAASVPAFGYIRSTDDRQILQSQEGGSVAQLPVREGQHVRKGQLLVQFASASAFAQERALAVRAIGLRAEIARLEALQRGTDVVENPPEFASLEGSDRIEADRAMALARSGLLADLRIERTEGALVGSQISQIGAQIDGNSLRAASNDHQIALNDRELDQVQQLADKGYAPLSRVLALRRSHAALAGEVGSLRSEMARLEASKGEARLNLLRAHEARVERRAEDLRNAQSDYQAVLPQWHAAKEALNRSRIVSAIDGTVMNLTVLTPGSVAAPGQKLMEIVPDDRATEIEAQIAPSDINWISPGKRAEVQIAGVSGRNLPQLDAVLTQISATSAVDERTGRPYYKARLRIEPGALARLEKAASLAQPIRAGTPVTAQVVLYPRSALDYLLSPLAQALTGPIAGH